ncbi:unnamed protein product [Parajaminaea phylloscopi]
MSDETPAAAPEGSSSLVEASTSSVVQRPISSSRWHLSAALSGHASDVKAIVTALVHKGEREAIFSVSRDSTARTWTRRIDEPDAEWVQGPTFQGGGRFLNAVVVVPGRHQDEADSLVVGGLDGLLRCFSLPDDLTVPTIVEEPDRIVQEHYDNITALRWAPAPSAAPGPSDDPADGRSDLLASSSWDYTARSFRRDVKGKWHRHHLLKGHESAVWGVEVVDATLDQERYLTASADLFVRLYEQEEIKVIWSGHSDVVRDIRLLLPSCHGDATPGPLFATSSNDPEIVIHSLSPDHRPPGIPTNGGDPIAKLCGHSSIVYSLSTIPRSETIESKKDGHRQNTNDARGAMPRAGLVSASEDGTVRIWDWSLALVAHSQRQSSGLGQGSAQKFVDGDTGVDETSPPCAAQVSSPLIDTIVHPPEVTSVWTCAVAPASDAIVTGSNDGLVRVYVPTLNRLHAASLLPGEEVKTQ